MGGCIDSDSHVSVVRDGDATVAPNVIDFVFCVISITSGDILSSVYADGMVLSTSESMTGAADRLV